MIKCIKYATSGTFDKAWRKGNWLLLNSNYEGGPTSDTGFFNHIEPPEGGYTLYLYKENNGPSIYVFNNNTELFDFCNNNLGAAQSNIIGTLDWIETQDNYFVDPTYFKFDVSTSESGVSDLNQFQLPLLSNGSIDFVVDWGDGTQNTITSYDQSETLHTYSVADRYTVKIAGILRGWSFNGGGDRYKFVSASKWGCFNLTNSGAFRGCEFFYISEGNLLDVPRISGTIIFAAFDDIRSLADTESRPQGFGGWDVSNVQNFNSMFRYAEYGSFVNFDLEYWDMSSAIFISGMFFGCRDFNAPIGNWDVGNVTNMPSTFNGTYSFNQPIGNWDTSKVSTMQSMFQNSRFNQPIGNWNTYSVTSMRSMFQGSNYFNQPIGNWDVTSVSSMNSMFRFATVFDQDISDWNVINVIDFSNFMQGNSVFSHLDAVYSKWSQLNVIPFRSINFGGATYTSAGAAGRAVLVNDFGWTIIDGGQV